MTQKKSTDDTRVTGQPTIPYAQIPEPLLYDADLSDGAKLLYCVLARHAATGDGTLWSGRKRLGKLCGCSADTVDRRTKELQRAGWIELVPRYRDKLRITNGYHLIPWHQVDIGGARLRGVTGEGGRVDAATWPHRRGGVAAPVRHRTKALELKPLNESPTGSANAVPLVAINDATDKGPPPRADSEDLPSEPARARLAGFDGFWDAYPKRRGVTRGPKNQAQTAWGRLSVEDQGRATVGAVNYAGSQDPEFVRDAVRFLRDRTFDDYQEARARKASRGPVRAGPPGSGPIVVTEVEL